ncbi:MAG: hypothetical protein V8R43_05965 [Dorea sp.]
MKKTETKEREINVLSLKDMKDTDEMHYGLNGSPTQVQKIFPPAVNDKKEIWNEAGDVLAEKLFDKIVEMKFKKEEKKAAELIIHQEKVTDNQELVKDLSVWGNGRKRRKTFNQCGL